MVWMMSGGFAKQWGRTRMVGRGVVAIVAGHLALVGCGSGATTYIVADHPAGSGATETEPALEETTANAEQASYESDAPPKVGPWIGAAGATGALMPGHRESSVGIWVDIPEAANAGYAPVALSLVIDTSGSMAGEKMRNARKAAHKLVDGLHDGDIVSIVTFDDRSEERLTPTVLDARSRARIRGTIDELSTGGGTNLFDGLRQGAGRVMGAPASHAVKRVVVISDGIANVGPSTPEVLGEVAERGADRGVQVTALGVGLDYDETTLNALAMRSSGRLYHLAEAKEMAGILERELGLLQNTRATDAFVEILPAPGVQLVDVVGARADRWQTGFRIPLGSMHAGQRRELLVRVGVDAPQDGEHPLASVRLHFKDPSDGGLERVQEVVARYEVVHAAEAVAASMNPKTNAIVAMMEAGQIAAEAARDVNEDRFDAADGKLAMVEKKLMESATQVADKRERERLIQTAQTVRKARSGAAAAAAAPAPARPAMKRKEALEMNDMAMDAFGL